MSDPIILNIGDNAPDFNLPTDGTGTASLAGYSGQNIVVYFYPKDNTPGCTTEAKDFRDAIDDFTQAGAAILGISRDSVKKHDNFKAKHELPFPLGSDEDGTMCEAYGTWVEKSLYGKKYMGISRDTFLIDGTGKIVQIWRKAKVKNHVQEVLNAVKSL